MKPRVSPDTARLDQKYVAFPNCWFIDTAPDADLDADGAAAAVPVLEPDIVMEPVMVIMEPDIDMTLEEPAVATADAGRLASVVKAADRPVAFLHEDGVEVAFPVTKLMAAHCMDMVVSCTFQEWPTKQEYRTW